MLLMNKVVFSDNGVLSDLSSSLSDVQDGDAEFDVVAAEDYIYIGSEQPFNHRFFSMLSPNSIACSISVDIWDGSWTPAVDVQDLTKLEGAAFGKSGLVIWTPQIYKFWRMQPASSDITGLSGTSYYNLYWVRMKFSSDISVGLKYVGHKFARDSDLNVYYAELNNSSRRAAYFDGTDHEDEDSWDIVHIAAAEEIIRDLRAKQVIWSPNQILDPDQFRDASIHKLAEIVFTAFGPSHRDKRDDAAKYYAKAMDKVNFRVDRNGDAKLSNCEKISTSRILRV
jgi:hypothetical protein